MHMPESPQITVDRARATWKVFEQRNSYNTLMGRFVNGEGYGFSAKNAGQQQGL